MPRPEDAHGSVVQGSGRGDHVVYGLLTLAGIEIALPLEAVREVVTCPAELAPLPAQAEGLLGAMSLRELVVPVLDVAHGLPTRNAGVTDHRVVVVVGHGDRLFGLLADGTRDVVAVPQADVRPVHAEQGPLLFSHTFRHAVPGGVVSVLDVPAVLRLPGVPTVHEPPSRGRPTAVAGGASALRRTLTLVRCDEHLLALDVAHVHTTLAELAPQPSVLDSDLCRGVIEHAAQQVPVVDPLVLLGLGRLPSHERRSGLVLDLGHGYVVLAVTTLVDIVSVAADDVLPLPAFAPHRPDLLSGLTALEGGDPCLVLDGDALHAEPDLQALASMNVAAVTEDVAGATASTPDADTGEAGLAQGPAYLTYSVGFDITSPLEQVAEILPYPATAARTGRHDGIRGAVVHRRAAVPIVCLPTLLGLPRPSITATSCLLLLEVDGEHVAFAVEAIRAIGPRTWAESDDASASPARLGRGRLDLARALSAAPLVSVGGERRVLPELDLHAVARAIQVHEAGGIQEDAVLAA